MLLYQQKIMLYRRKNNVILDNTNVIHQQSDVIPPSIDVKQQDKVVIPQYNVSTKPSTAKNDVIPIDTK